MISLDIFILQCSEIGILMIGLQQYMILSRVHSDQGKEFTTQTWLELDTRLVVMQVLLIWLRHWDQEVNN
jgi:hypothetical protein